jgi:hypothetical protein
MKLDPSVKPAVLGVVIGAVATMVLGFSVMGWVLADSAEQMATDRAGAAVVDVLVPICVERFQRQDDWPARLIEFKSTPSWSRHSVIEKGGWAASSGTEKIRSAIIVACAEKLGRLS